MYTYEPFVSGCVFRQHDDALVFDDPAGNTLADLDTEVSKIGRVRHLRGSQYNFATTWLE